MAGLHCTTSINLSCHPKSFSSVPIINDDVVQKVVSGVNSNILPLQNLYIHTSTTCNAPGLCIPPPPIDPSLLQPVIIGPTDIGLAPPISDEEQRARDQAANEASKKATDAQIKAWNQADPLNNGGGKKKLIILL